MASERSLPEAPSPNQQEGRQCRGLPAPLGEELPLHGGARRRLHHDGPSAGAVGGDDGKNPQVGIIQTAPRIVFGETLYSRLQSFASRLYSPLFLAGLNYWQQHDGNYWGHNAIIRIQPFIEHCALPDLPGSEPFGGRILSHDFVEAALMRRAGWAVWLAGDIDGSFEEGPPTLIESAKRDRRWCQGNMQHTWLLTARGFRPANRFHLLMGVMGYASSPLWLLFLALSTIHVFGIVSKPATPGVVRVEDMTSVFGYMLRVPEALTLFVFTLLLLFLPKIVSVVQTLGNPELVGRFGGRTRLALSAVVETVVSGLLAPVNMMFNAEVRPVHPARPRGRVGDTTARGRG